MGELAKILDLLRKAKELVTQKAPDILDRTSELAISVSEAALAVKEFLVGWSRKPTVGATAESKQLLDEFEAFHKLIHKDKKVTANKATARRYGAAAKKDETDADDYVPTAAVAVPYLTLIAHLTDEVAEALDSADTEPELELPQEGEDAEATAAGDEADSG